MRTKLNKTCKRGKNKNKVQFLQLRSGSQYNEGEFYY